MASLDLFPRVPVEQLMWRACRWPFPVRLIEGTKSTTAEPLFCRRTAKGWEYHQDRPDR